MYLGYNKKKKVTVWYRHLRHFIQESICYGVLLSFYVLKQVGLACLVQILKVRTKGLTLIQSISVSVIIYMEYH